MAKHSDRSLDVATKKLSENVRKSNEISLEPQFCENQTKNITTKFFGEFSVSYRQTNCESYLNKDSTILVPHLSQVIF